MTKQQSLYHVHVYCEMRLYFPGIKADSSEDAARIASDMPTDEAEIIDDCEGVTLAALVDVDGDAEYSQSILIDFCAPRKNALKQVLESALTELCKHPNSRPPTPLSEVIHRALTLAQTL